MVDAKKIDPFDIEALEKSLNDSATRVSTIWISFLIFSLYLLTAATTVTHRQLLLAEPVKLPVLSIDLPLWGFFFLTPILFVIFHAYVLLQVLLLGRTAATYNDAVDDKVKAAADNSRVRQRLANTLLAQIFAGSPREREGFVGSLLRAIVWITLAIGPILIILTFQFSFLPYHSHIATWTHRLLIVFELAAFFLIWPLALDAQKDFQWPEVGQSFKRLISIPMQLFRTRQPDRPSKLWFRERTAPLAASAAFVLLSLSLATFPGEPHVNLFTGQSLYSVNCGRLVLQEFERIDLRLDRLILPHIDIVDDEKLEKIQNAGKQKSISPSQTERVRSFRNRDFRCASFVGADFRHVDFDGASLTGVNFNSAELQGASFDKAVLDDAQLLAAKLDGAGLRYASLRETSLSYASMREAVFTRANLQGANLDYSDAVGAAFVETEMIGTSINGARFTGVDFSGAQLQGANLKGSDFRASFFGDANLQGVLLADADLRASYFSNTQLNGADLRRIRLDKAEFFKVNLWQAQVDKCDGIYVDEPRFVAGVTELPTTREFRQYEYSPVQLDHFLEGVLAGLPVAKQHELRNTLHERLAEKPDQDQIKKLEGTWRDCANSALPLAKHRASQTAYLVKLACSELLPDEPYMASGIAVIWTGYWMDSYDPTRAKEIALGLLGRNNKPCPGASQMSIGHQRMLARIAESKSN
jgi:uncharacterized protein YjbI with pentapeptide repeats/MFS family permease